MTLAAIVQLLQTALLLLTLAQGPNVPPALKTQATVIANQAIAAATQALAKPATPSTAVPTTFTPTPVPAPTPTPSAIPTPTPSPAAKRSCNVFRFGQDIYMGVLDANGTRIFDLRIGSAGVISSLRGPDYQELLAKSFAGERTDRVAQWVIWGKNDLYSLTGSGPLQSSEWYKNAFNVTQAGSMEDRVSSPQLQDTLWVEASLADCRVDVYAAPSKQWFSALTNIFPAKFQSLTRYTVTADKAVRIQRLILIPRAFQEFRLDDWTPLAKSEFDRLAFDINDSGAVNSSSGTDIGYLDRDVATFQNGKGYVIAYNTTAPTSKPAVGVVFGSKQACNGSPCAPLGADRSDSLANAQSIVAPANHPCKKLPAGCGWNKSTINVMDWDYGATDKGIAIIPTAHFANVPAGSMYIDEQYLVLRERGLSSEMQNTVSRIASSVIAPQIIHAGQVVSPELEAIRTRLISHNSYSGMQTDSLGVYPVQGI